MKASFFLPKYWPTWLGLFLLRLISSLPWPVVAFLSDTLGSLIYSLYKSRREIAERNLRTCFPEWSSEQVSTTAKRSFQLGAQALFFTGVAWWASVERCKKLVDIDATLLDELIAQEKNSIVLMPHFVGLELAAVLMSVDRKMMAMFQYAKNPLLHHFVVSRRLRFGGHLIERKEPLRKMLKLLRKNIPMVYLPDQGAGRKGRFVPFFGVQASSFDMLGKITKMSDAVVIPCSIEILEKGKGVRVQLHKPLSDFPSGDDFQDTLKQNQAIESMVRLMPEQYLWAHKRFKTRPQGEEKFYRQA